MLNELYFSIWTWSILIYLACDKSKLCYGFNLYIHLTDSNSYINNRMGNIAIEY